jgi:cytoskeleton protein RodZ
VSLGANLKRERELRGISLQEIANETKISLRLLEALESDRYDLLPGGIFRKSFLKSYAEYLGMNEEQVLHEYTLAFESVPLALEEKQLQTKSITGPKLNWTPFIAIILALALFFAGYLYLRPPQEGSTKQGVLPSASSSQPSKVGQPGLTSEVKQENSTPGPPAVPASEPSVTATPAGGQSPSTVAGVTPPLPVVNPQLKVLGELAKKPQTPPPASESPVEPVPSGEKDLTIAATEPSWISVTSGQSRIFGGILKPNESRRFSLHTPLTLVIGNAGGVRVIVNGQTLAPLGKIGEKREIQISVENYKQFLPAPP